MPLGVDIGTYACLASQVTRRDIEPLPLGNTNQDTALRSVAYLARDGSVETGDGAWARYCNERHVVDRRGTLVENLKLRLLEPGWNVSHDDRSYTADDLLALLVSHVRTLSTQCRPDLDLKGSCFTVPFCFGTDHLARFREILRTAGWEAPTFLQEPVAVLLAWHQTETLASGAYLVVDIGHGTTDVAIVELLHDRGTPRACVRGTNGIVTVSGATVSDALMKALLEEPAYRPLDENRFLRSRGRLADAVGSAVASLSFDEVTDVIVPNYPNRDGDLDERLARTTLDQILQRAGMLSHLDIALEDLTDETGVPTSSLAGVLLTGRPSHTKLFARHLRESVPGVPLMQCRNALQSKELVSRGATLLANNIMNVELQDAASRTLKIAGLREPLVTAGSALPAARDLVVPVAGGTSELTVQEQCGGDGTRDVYRIRLPDDVRQAPRSKMHTVHLHVDIPRYGEFSTRLTQVAHHDRL